MTYFLKNILVLVFLAFFCGTFAMAQKTKKGTNKKKKKKIENLSLETDSIPSLELELTEEDLDVEDEEKKTKKKKKKKKRKIYCGIKTKRSLARSGTGGTKVQYFRYISMDYLLNDKYQQEIWYYDVKSKKVKNENYYKVQGKIKKGRNLLLLHGEYAMRKEGDLRAEGYFYKGLKHGRWKEYQRKGDELLIKEKVKYNMGLPEGSQIKYYDTGEAQVKEIIPMLHGHIEGVYTFFYKNGRIGEQGKYINDAKVGIWREWFENSRMKKQTQYPNFWWDDKEAQLLMEWNKNGKAIYNHRKGGKLD